MSLLPQRKKSAEELSQLRDQLGISPHPQPLAPSASPQMPEAAALATLAPEAHFPRKAPKPVRSLRRSEREPSPSRRNSQPTAFSRIPAKRHSSDEIAELRRREALAQFNTSGKTNLFPLPAPPWVIVPGYLFALSGFACQYWKQEIPLAATAATAGVALLFALYILLRRPLSRHHAGFISSITVFALVFASLHYFPHLRHAP